MAQNTYPLSASHAHWCVFVFLGCDKYSLHFAYVIIDKYFDFRYGKNS